MIIKVLLFFQQLAKIQDKQITQIQNQEIFETLPGTVDNYNVFHIEMENLIEKFQNKEKDLYILIRNTVQKQKNEKKKAIWFKINAKSVYLSQQAINNGFQFHHSEKDSITLFLWLKEDQNCTLPSYCTHLIGAGGVVINSQNQILLVKEKSGNRKNKWNIPMGRVDEGEQIHEAAIREVLEETGVESEYFDLITIREKTQDTFGKPDLFFVFLLKAKENTENQINQVKIQQEEICEFQWLDLNGLEDLVKEGNVMFPTQTSVLTYLHTLHKNNFQFYKQRLFDVKKHNFIDNIKTNKGATQFNQYLPSYLEHEKQKLIEENKI